MAAIGDVCAGLIQHKATLLRELCDTNLLDVLVKKGLFNLNDLELITSAVDSDKCNYFIELVSKQSGLKLQELCTILNKECPKLSQELMNDRHRYVINGYNTTHSAKENMVMNHNLNRRKRWLDVIGRPELNNPKTNPKCHFVCSLHFEKYMISSKPILKLDAEPTKFLPNQPNSFVCSKDFKDVSTQTECYLNGASAMSNRDAHVFPEVPIIKQENTQDECSQKIAKETVEITVSRIKQECIDDEFEPASTTEHIKDENRQLPTADAKPLRKTKYPRKLRKRTPRKEDKESKQKVQTGKIIKRV